METKENLQIPNEANLCIEKVDNGLEERYSILLCSEIDYFYSYYKLPMPKQLIRYISNSQIAGIVRE